MTWQTAPDRPGWWMWDDPSLLAPLPVHVRVYWLEGRLYGWNSLAMEHMPVEAMGGRWRFFGEE